MSEHETSCELVANIKERVSKIAVENNDIRLFTAARDVSDLHQFADCLNMASSKYKQLAGKGVYTHERALVRLVAETLEALRVQVVDAITV